MVAYPHISFSVAHASKLMPSHVKMNDAFTTLLK